MKYKLNRKQKIKVFFAQKWVKTTIYFAIAIMFWNKLIFALFLLLFLYKKLL